MEICTIRLHLSALLQEINIVGSSYLQVIKKLVSQFSIWSSIASYICIMPNGKYHHVPYILKVNKMLDHSYELVQSNIWEPCPISSKLGFKCSIIFLDNFSHVTGYT